MITPPQLQITREGITNFPEVRAWAERNCGEWHTVERMRKIHGWTDIEFHEVLACYLLNSLTLLNGVQGIDPNAEPPVLHQDMETSGRWTVTLTLLGFLLMLGASVAHFNGEPVLAIGIAFLGGGAFVGALKK